jgi:hypothetical protein
MMRKLVITGLSAIALSFGSFGTAQAQTVSLLESLQGETNALLDHMALFGEGNWVNVAVNVGVVNAGITAVGGPALFASVAGAGSIDVGIDPLNPLLIDVGLEGGLGASIEVLPFGQVHLGDLETMAVGVVSDQHIASHIVDESTETKTIEASAAAAASNTEKTSAEAEWSSFALDLDKSTHIGPKQPVFAANLAFNAAVLNAGVTLIGSHIETGNISTMAAGVVSTQTISMGFDGSAFNNAVNGQ